MKLDLRSLHWPPIGTGPNDREATATSATRFVYILACEHCLCRSRLLYGGRWTCNGCGRTIVLDQREEGLRL